MKSALAFLALVCAFALPAGAQAHVHHWRHPQVARQVLVELFTAQGCEGCPQADLALGELAKKKTLLALSFSVDIWDYTGWTDTFAQPEFTQRQQAYAKRLKLRELYTPEVVVNGAAEASGLDKTAVAGLIEKAGKTSAAAPSVAVSRDAAWVAIGAARAPAQAAEVWMIRYDPKPREVKVKAGDNKGKTVIVTNVVKELVKLGPWRGHVRRYDLPDALSEGLKTAVVVQGPQGGPVLAIGRN